MSNEKNAPQEDLQIGDLEATATEATATTDKKEKKVQTAEEAAALGQAIEKVKEFGVSENFAKMLPLVHVWNGEKEELADKKAEIIEAFGGSEAFKDYIDGAFADELAVIAGIGKVVTTGNNIKSFYGRRAGSGTSKKVKTIQIGINNEYYTVSEEYYTSLAGKSSQEKKELLLAHPGTTKNAPVEVL